MNGHIHEPIPSCTRRGPRGAVYSLCKVNRHPIRQTSTGEWQFDRSAFKWVDYHNDEESATEMDWTARDSAMFSEGLRQGEADGWASREREYEAYAQPLREATDRLYGLLCIDPVAAHQQQVTAAIREWVRLLSGSPAPEPTE